MINGDIKVGTRLLGLIDQKTYVIRKIENERYCSCVGIIRTKDTETVTLEDELTGKTFEYGMPALKHCLMKIIATPTNNNGGKENDT